MRSQLLNSHQEKTWALIFETDDEPMTGLREFARDNRLSGSHFTAIGAFSEVTVAYFDWESKQYQPIPIQEQVEVISLIGDIALTEDGEPQVHAHVVVGRKDGTTRGGHLLSARVRPTLEVVLVESPQHLRRKHDPESGLALIDLDADTDATTS